MITRHLSVLPASVRIPVLTSLIANMNARLFSYARQEYGAIRRGERTDRLGAADIPGDSMHEDQHGVDGANSDDENKRALANERSGDPARSHTNAQGFIVTNPREAAEPFVTFKSLLLDAYEAECVAQNVRRMMDQSLASYANWQRETEFVANRVMAKALVKASGGAFTEEQQIASQKVNWEIQRRDTIKNLEPILRIAEDFNGLPDAQGNEEPWTIDSLFDAMTEYTQLSLMNAVYKKLCDLFTNERNGFQSGKVRTQDLAGDIAMTAAVRDDLIVVTAPIYEACFDEYRDRLLGFGDFPIVIAIEAARKKMLLAKKVEPQAPRVTERILRKGPNSTLKLPEQKPAENSGEAPANPVMAEKLKEAGLTS